MLKTKLKTHFQKSPKVGVIWLYLGVVLVSNFFAYAPAQANERTLQISPPLTEMVVDPGQVSETSLTVINKGSDLLALEAFVRDFVAGPAGDAPRILGENERSSFSLKDWLLLSDKQFVLQPDESKTIRVTVAIPQSAEAGGHYGLVGFTAPNTELPEGVTVEPSIAALFFVTVTGDLVESAELIRFGGESISFSGRADLSLTLKNTGNVHLLPAGTIRLKNLLGRTAAELPINPDERIMLPASERTFVTTWEPRWSFGPYRAQATVSLGEAGQTLVSSEVTVWMLPLRLIGIGFLTLILAILIAYEWQHRRLKRRLSGGGR